MGEMTKVCSPQSLCHEDHSSYYLQVAQESLSALRTVQSFNAVSQETEKFHDRVTNVLNLARKEAIASGIFFGGTGWSGNVTLLALLGYGRYPPIVQTIQVLMVT